MEKKALETVQATIKDADKKLDELRVDINKARTAGIDVKQRETELADLTRKLSALKTAYL